jgi:hypothetical protein
MESAKQEIARAMGQELKLLADERRERLRRLGFVTKREPPWRDAAQARHLDVLSVP